MHVARIRHDVLWRYILLLEATNMLFAGCCNMFALYNKQVMSKRVADYGETI